MKTRYNTREKLNSKTTPLLIIVSSISVLLLMIYFGVSLTSKGTFTLENNDVKYYCSDGSIPNNISTIPSGRDGCCTDPRLPSWELSTNRCVSDYYGTELLTNDGFYCITDDMSVCDQLSEFESTTILDDSSGCKFLCSQPGNNPVSCTINGENGFIDDDGICQNVEHTCTYGSLGYDSSRRIIGTVVVSGEDTAGVCCPEGYTEINDNECATTIDTVNHRYRQWAGATKCIDIGDDDYSEEISTGWCVLVEQGNDTPELESIDKDRCNILNNMIVHVTTCEKMQTGTNCDDDENKDKLCYMSDGTTIKRCDLAPEDSPICFKKCKYCSNGVEKVDSSVPNRGQACSAYHDGYHEYSETLNCSSDMNNNNTTTTINNGNVTDNAQTGSTAIIIAWIIGITAIGYAFYYFRETSIKN